MQAVVYTEYGAPEVLELREIRRPAPGDNEVLIRVRAACASAGDCELRRGVDLPNALFRPALRLMLGWRRPRRPVIPGMYLAGEVEAVGSGVQKYAAGDRVFGTSSMRMGACAEYVCVPAHSTLTGIPDSVGYEEAAASPLGGLNALHFIRLARLASGRKILINGAGGGIGTFAIQLAKLEGAQVTAVDHTSKQAFLLSVGADHALDYTTVAFTQEGARYDVILDIAGTAPFAGCLGSLTPSGRYILANPFFNQMIRAIWATKTSNRAVTFEFARETTEELESLATLLSEGKVHVYIDRTYPLAQAREAHAYVETGLKQGNVIITP